MKDPTDKDVIETALRETKEEIYIDKSQVDILGTLANLPNKTGLVEVTPIVGYIGKIDPSKITFNKDEVHEVFTLPLSHLSNPSNRTYRQFRDTTLKIPVYHGGEKRRKKKRKKKKKKKEKEKRKKK